MPDQPAVLIAAASGRALAQSARRGGYLPLVADFFADQDTVMLAHDHVRIEDGLARGMDADRLLPAFQTLARSRQPIGAVCGTGFEDRPELLARISERWRLLGNDAQIVATVKDPYAFAALCRDCAIPHPETVHSLQPDRAGWVAKRKGGAGGSHIAGASAQSQASDGFYFQRTTPGVPVSALFLADGGRAMTLGFSTQWASPTPRRPFRYGGAVRPPALAPLLAGALTDAVDRLLQAIPLVGLNSADFLVDGDQFRLLEINPRPGATLDVFEPAEGSLFALHVAACEGKLDCVPPRFEGACAAAIVYADRDITAVPAIRWPDWIADRPQPGTAMKAGEPLCTVKAAATTAAAAKAAVDERLAMVLAMVRDWTHARMS
ncbi:MAG TPA: ATP-grasp domain-containing protein [Xanthobacteraceae bacterium]|nr:ATP-grasp domain-containing protein [Xanthobacteraceae bacterium]